MEKRIWIEEMLNGNIARGANAYGMIGYLEVETNSEGNVEWTVPMLDDSFFTTESHELAQIIAQNETITALLLRQQKKMNKK